MMALDDNVSTNDAGGGKLEKLCLDFVKGQDAVWLQLLLTKALAGIVLPSIVGYCYTALVPLILPAMSPPAPGSIAKECQDNEFLTRISKHWHFLRVMACWKYIFHTLTMLHYYSKLHFRYSQLILLIH